MTMTITPQDDTEFETSGRRRKITKFALSGVAVLGVGAALTSAAWTDNVWFAGDASTGTLDLIGSGDDGATWEEGDSSGTAITITAFDEIGPDITVTRRLWVENQGSLPVQLDPAQLDSKTGDLFVGDPTLVDPDLPPAEAADVQVGSWDRTVIDNGERAWVDVTVTGGPWNGAEYQGAAGSLVIHVQGQSIAAP